jgi:hypothetical protein
LNTDFYVKILVGGALGSALGGAIFYFQKPKVLIGGALGGALLTVLFDYKRITVVI